MHSDKKKYLVCTLKDLKILESYGWEKDINGTPIQCFLIHHEKKVYSYLNRCPHTGVNLDWVTNQFLDHSKKLIQCATHGAIFDIKDGVCLRGPCLGDRLQIIENVVIEDNIYLIL
jgi:nitrite reductase/ring-hydroxylating ferredoxin subunit